MNNSNFKYTEIGPIPNDWEVKALGEICNLVRGSSPRPAGSPLYFNGNYIPWLTVASITNISDSQLYVTQTDSCLTELGSHFSRVVEKGSIIISNSGATLGVAKILSVKSCANDGIAILNNLSNDYEPLFIVYSINRITEYLRNSIATGNGQPNLNTERIGNLLFAFPPLPEQRRIAAALSDIDALIDNLDALIDKKRLIKQATMQQLLSGKKRINGFNDKWVMKKLGEIGTFVSGNCFPLSFQGDKSNDLPFYKVSDFNNLPNERFLSIANNYISKIISKSLHCNIIPKGAIVFAKIGAAIFLERKRLASIDCCIDNNMMSFQSSELYDKMFLLYIFNTISLSDLVNATALPALKTKDLQDLEITLPPTLAEQTAISKILSDMDEEISLLEAKKEKYTHLKQGMMSELLSGRIRI